MHTCPEGNINRTFGHKTTMKKSSAGILTIVGINALLSGTTTKEKKVYHQTSPGMVFICVPAGTRYGLKHIATQSILGRQ